MDNTKEKYIITLSMIINDEDHGMLDIETYPALHKIINDDVESVDSGFMKSIIDPDEDTINSVKEDIRELAEQNNINEYKLYLIEEPIDEASYYFSEKEAKMINTNVKKFLKLAKDKIKFDGIIKEYYYSKEKIDGVDLDKFIISPYM